MGRFIAFLLVFIFTLFQCQGQSLTDTIFSGRSRDIDLSSSINMSLIESLKGMNLCHSQPFKNVEGVHPKSNVPFLLQYYSKRRLKNSSLFEFDALIYTAICGHYDFMSDTYILELFFEDDKRANAYIKSLDKLYNFFEYAKKHDVLESKDELVAAIVAYNFFYKRKGNVIYIFHKNLPLNDDLSTVQTLKLNFFNLIDSLHQNKNK
jgi:hypothetical protein